MRNPHPWRTLGILVLLATAVAAPVLGSGLWHLRRGTNAIRVGEYSEAASALESAARMLPWRTDLWEMAGQAAYASGDVMYSLQLLEAARARNALSATGWEIMGSCLWASGQESAALNTWTEGATLHRDEPALLDRLAAGYHELGDYESEQAALSKRLSVGEDPAAYYRLGLLLMLSDAGQARAAFEAATALNPDVRPAARTLTAALGAAETESDVAKRMVVIGRSLGLVEEWAIAHRAFTIAVEADGASAEALAWRGEALQHLDEDGRPDLDAALSRGWESSVVHTLRGLYWRRQGNLGMSLAEYTRASQLEPRNAALQSLVGEAQAANGDLVAALAAYETAVELAPAESTYWRLLALFCADNNVQVLDVGVAAGLKAVELAPSDPQALDALGWAYAQAGYLHKAEEALVKALTANPDFATAHLHLGLTYMRWGQNDKALEHWSRAAQIDGNGAVGEYAGQLLNTYFPQQ
jgi:tetratricopeptide (TPR) repeat protein